MATTLLMPKATAVWLVDNTGLTFDQIASFCALHPLEVQGIADGDVAAGIKGVNPVLNGQLSREEIEKAEADSNYRMKLRESTVRVPAAKRKGPRYTPVSKRQEKPNAILWLVRSHPELKDAQIMRLVGTTKPTIESVRERSHWNAANQTPMDPVTLGLCTQIELDMEVRKAAKDLPPSEETEPRAGLLSAEEALSRAEQHRIAAEAMVEGFEPSQPAPAEDDEFDAESVFANLKSLKSDDSEEDEDDGKSGQ
ncbi:DUF1013 domain-containing protein [Cucumibacter marinus]|uniref:DUF1013 domain-containing protein n=1 Tax=Cucumibacter marinus TaxID=1121252 RepID=UPI00041FF17A|nr:cell cycle transcriptional regulator TrcR [Cucumibacter marinus]